MTDDRDYDALAAKLAEVEEMKRLLAMDKINLRGELAGVQGKLAAANDLLDRLEQMKDNAEVTEDRDDLQIALASARKQLELYIGEAEAALPAVYRLALEDAVNTLRTKRTHMHTTRHEMAQDIRALPTPTAAELMARIQTGEKE